MTEPTTHVAAVEASAVAHAMRNLQHWIDAYRGVPGEAMPPVVVAAQHLLAQLDPAAIEDREYHSYDLTLPVEDRCGAFYGKWGRACSRRAGHVNARHRDGEISWTDEMAEVN